MRNYSSITRNPWTFVPTLYFFEGLPYVLINTVSVILYKRMGVDNASIAFWTSWLYLPGVIKMFWAPTVEITKPVYHPGGGKADDVAILIIFAPADEFTASFFQV